MNHRCLSALTLLLIATVAFGQSPINPTPSTGMITTNGYVRINDVSASSGQTLFPGNTIKTAPESSSTLSLINSARLKLGPASEVRLEFSPTSVSGAVVEGRVDMITPAGIRTQINTEDTTVTNDASQPTVFSIQVNSCVTVVSVQSGRVELRNWNHVLSLLAGERFSTGTPSSMPVPQHNLNKKGRVGIIAGIGAAVAVILVAITGKKKEETDEQFGGCIDLLSGESNCR